MLTKSNRGPSSPEPASPSSFGGARPPGSVPAPEPYAHHPEPAPRAEPARAGEKPASILGPDLKIRGGIEGRGEIHLQGRAWGDVKVERLLVGDVAELEGSVVANVVEVRGRVLGAIDAHTVRLHPTAMVEGDITYEQLHIEVGAQFEGRCIRSKQTSEPAQPAGSTSRLAEPDRADGASAEPESEAVKV